ncbi:MAG TPA: nuclear transport factor 2 family protein [Thermoleophilaceae bacterium]|jgi:ketosteroid isomerase-like protein
MAQDNIQIVLEENSRYNAGDHEPRLEFWHEDAEYHQSREDPDADVHRGIDEIRALFARWSESYPDLTSEPLEARGNGPRVFLWVRLVGRGARSGLPMEMELGQVYWLRDGRVERLDEYPERAEALAAAGLTD